MSKILGANNLSDRSYFMPQTLRVISLYNDYQGYSYMKINFIGFTLMCFKREMQFYFYLFDFEIHILLEKRYCKKM